MHLNVGDEAPEFHARDRMDRIWSLDGSGTPLTLLTFWKTSCSTCQITFPYLERIALDYPKTVTVIGVVQDAHPDAGAEWAQKWGASFPIISDQAPYPISMSYDPAVTPTLFLIDNRRGRILSVYEACVKADLNALSHTIASIGKVSTTVVALDGDGNPAWTPG